MMPVLCSAIVLYDFEATPNSQEMSVLSGSKLDIIEKQEDGYVCDFQCYLIQGSDLKCREY